MSCSVEVLDGRVTAELAALPKDVRASFERTVNLIKTRGLERTHEPAVKHLNGRLWEMRLKGRDGTEKAPRREIELALQRAKEVK